MALTPHHNPAAAAGPAEMLAFLASPDAYPHRPARVQIIQTHISIVALAGDLVFKVKKPVNFGFADFSTLELRRHFCRREVELNRRLCPDLYLGVVPIIRREGRLHFAEPAAAEPAVDFAVKMQRLDDRLMLRTMLDAGNASAADVDRIVERLAAFYRLAPIPPPDLNYGTPAVVRQTLSENLFEARKHACTLALGPPGRSHAPAKAGALEQVLDTLAQYVDGWITRNLDTLEQRIRQGWIRDGHGDLRPEHIHLSPHRVCVFDCVEFNDRLRCCDVAAEAAFLAMELDAAGRSDLSRYWAERFAAALGDQRMPELLPFYKCYRAIVRGKVHAILASEPEVACDVRMTAAKTARRYFQRALTYALAEPRPIIIPVMGPVAAGKTSVAAALSEDTGWPVFSSDVVRKELAGVPLHGRPAMETRRRLYTAEMSERTYARLIDLACQAVADGGGALLDATFGRRRFRDLLHTAAASVGADLVFVELHAEHQLIAARLTQREGRTDLVTDARLEDLSSLSKTYEPPRELPDDRCIRAEAGSPVEAIARQVWATLLSRRLR